MRFKDNEGNFYKRSRDAEMADIKSGLNNVKNKAISKFKETKVSLKNKININKNNDTTESTDYSNIQSVEVEDDNRPLTQLISELSKYDKTMNKEDVTLEEAEKISILTNLIRKRIDDIESSMFKY